ncbi:hypothetical protein V5799_012276, partial [Amblyomma americanum]
VHPRINVPKLLRTSRRKAPAGLPLFRKAPTLQEPHHKQIEAAEAGAARGRRNGDSDRSALRRRRRRRTAAAFADDSDERGG